MPDVDVELEAPRFRALVDGLVVHLVTAPQDAPPHLALAVVEDHLAGLRSPGARSQSHSPGGDRKD